MSHATEPKVYAQPTVRLTAADAVGAVAQALDGVKIIVVDGAGVPTGDIFESGAAGSAPQQVAAAGVSSVIKNNFTATANPAVTDDSGDGYEVGSRWVNVTADESWICVDATVGAAVWSLTTVGTIAEVAGLQTALDATVKLAGAQTISGVKTFSALPEMSADATTANQPVRKSQHDTAMALKAPLASPTLTGTATVDGTVKLGNGQDVAAPAPVVTDVANIYAAAASTASTTISTSDIATRISRSGTTGTKWNNALDIVLGSHTAGLNANTQVDFRLNNGAVGAPDTTVLTLRGDGQILVSANPTAALGVTTKQYVDGLLAGLLDYRGAFTPAVSSGAAGYPTTGGSGAAGAVLKGDAFAASAVGFVLTEAIQAGDWVVAKVDTPAQTAANWDKLNANVSYVPADDAAVVKMTGDQTVAGIKTFSSLPEVGSNASTANQVVRKSQFDTKQDSLVSGTNIKTLNSQSILGSGDIAVGASAASVTTRVGGTGGAVTEVVINGQRDRVHTLTGSGNFVVPTGVTAVRVLAVGGGGGGGAGRYRGDASGRPGGGGGAGGLVHNATFAVTPGATIAYSVGAGGAGATDVDDSDAGTGGLVGGNSTFGSITAYGGGGGGHHETNSAPWDVPADQGGSGGGGSNGSGGVTQSAAAASAGNAGNSGGSFGGDSGGGGGGAGGAGGNGNLPSAGNGGAGGVGLANTITGTSVVYAAGGQGSSGSATTGMSGAAGSNNLGNGGGGAFDGGSDGTAGAKSGGNGGSGVVIVRYLYQSLDTPVYANNAAAIAGGLTLGQLYRTGADPDTLCVVH